MLTKQNIEGEEFGSLRLSISQTVIGRYHVISDNYDGPGSMMGTGSTTAEAAADFCEQYADAEVVAKLTEAWEAINAQGGTDGGSYNDAIGDALAIIERLGAPQGRRK